MYVPVEKVRIGDKVIQPGGYKLEVFDRRRVSSKPKNGEALIRIHYESFPIPTYYPLEVWLQVERAK